MADGECRVLCLEDIKARNERLRQAVVDFAETYER